MKPLEKQQARELRCQGHSVKEISRELAVSKGTISRWVRDIVLSPQQIAILDRRITDCRTRFGYLSRCGGANTNKADAEKRHRSYECVGYERARTDEHFRLICALYWGEGSKRSRCFSVSNSDPALLRVIMDWLIGERYDEVLSFRVQYYAENGRSEEEIRGWWHQQLPNLKLHHWRKLCQCRINRASQRKKTGALPQGTGSMTVHRAELFYNVLGGIRFLKEKGDW